MATGQAQGQRERVIGVRNRWGVQMRSKPSGVWEKWQTIGGGWFPELNGLPPSIDHWPASFKTRREARQAVRAQIERSRSHSPNWQFREVKLRIVIHAESR